jgi:hypothetical protein
MGKLIYAANTSLDGYLEDENGSFDWSVPDLTRATRAALRRGRAVDLRVRAGGRAVRVTNNSAD